LLVPAHKLRVEDSSIILNNANSSSIIQLNVEIKAIMKHDISNLGWEEGKAKRWLMVIN
jgi:hypothetical protein